MIYIRKLSTSFIYIAHQKYIPESITGGFEPYFIYKTSKDKFVISQEFFIKDSDSLKHPDSIIVDMPSFDDYNEHYLDILSQAFTDFKFNIDWLELKQKLSAFNVGENLKEAVAEFLNNLTLSETKEYNEFNMLESIPLTKIYLALCLKKKTIIPVNMKIGDLINSTLVGNARKIIKDNNLLDDIIKIELKNTINSDKSLKQKKIELEKILDDSI